MYDTRNEEDIKVVFFDSSAAVLFFGKKNYAPADV
jgi:hypothetical protein